MITIGDLEVLFSGLETRLEGAAEYRAKSASLIGADFSVFRFIDYESRFSSILADLLNPTGSHGQGGIFFSKFLDLIENRSVNSPIGVIPATRERLRSRRISVHREQPTHNGRFVDIVVSGGDIGFGIENKPWAADRIRQLQDYAAYLSSHFRNGWVLLYVSGTGNLPTTQSLPSSERQRLIDEGTYLELSYAADLAEWLDACIHTCDADKVRWFLRDFQDFAMTKFKIAQSSGERADD